MTTIRALSLFSGIGIGTSLTGVPGSNVLIAVANELDPKRAEVFRRLHPTTKMIVGDITDQKIFDAIVNASIEEGADLVLATPPCQGMSKANTTGKNRDNDPRNKLIISAVEVIKAIRPRNAVIENVFNMTKTMIQNGIGRILIPDYMEQELDPLGYDITNNKVDAADYGTAQHRRRLIVLACLDGAWFMPPPTVKKYKTVRDAIGHLPSLDVGEKSHLTWHSDNMFNMRHREALRHTPEGKSAFDNKNPKDRPTTIDKITGRPRRTRAFANTYKREVWDKPANTITMSNGSISSSNTVHPGRPLPDGTQSDSRPKTVRELLLLSGPPENYLDAFPEGDKIFTESFFRRAIGEAVSPNVIEAIFASIKPRG